MKQSSISIFRGEYAWLSNFYRCPITYKGMTYACVENAFQAAKCANPEDRDMFCGQLHAKEAKRLGRKVHLRRDWEKVKYDVMLELLFIKFGTNKDLLKRLLATGDTELVEENRWHDNEWGNCRCPRCSTIEGQNILGKLLMSVRSTYMQYYTPDLSLRQPA